MADIKTTLEIQAQDKATAVIKILERELSKLPSTLDNVATRFNSVSKNSEIVANKMQSVTSAAANTNRGLEQNGNTILSIATKYASFAALVSGAFKAVNLAADLDAATKKASVVFRNNVQNMQDAIGELTNSYGMSRVEATKTVAALGDLFKPLGFSEESALKLSNATAKLAADLASFNKIPTADVIRDIQSALVGNTESVRKYGVVLNEATIAQAAVEAGLNPKNLSAAQKSYLILQQIIKSNSDALGDYQRNQESFNNTINKVKNTLIEIALGVGESLIQLIQPVLNAINNFLPALQKIVVFLLSTLTPVLKFAIQTVIDSFKTLFNILDVLATAFIRTFTFVLQPILQRFSEFVLATVNIILKAVAAVWNRIASVAKRIGVELPALEDSFRENVTSAIEKASESMNTFIKKVEKGQTAFEALGLVANKTASAVEKTSENLSDIVKKVSIPAAKEKLTTEDKTKKAATAAIGGQAGIPAFAAEIFEKIVSALAKHSQAFNYFYNILENAFNTIAARLGPILDNILMPFVKLLDTFFIIAGELLGDLLIALKPVLNIILESLSSAGALIITQLALIFKIITPLISFLAQILAPFMRVTSFALKLIYNVFVSIYNNIFVPIINIIIAAFNAIGGSFAAAINFVVDIINGIINVVNEILGWLRWQKIGHIQRMDWKQIAAVQTAQLAADTDTAVASAAAGGMGGLAVKQERAITVNFTNNGVLAGFKSEEEFIAWIKQGFALATARGG